MENPKKMVAFAIVERLGQKNRWIRLGPAYENKDGSLNVKVESLPLDVFATGNFTINIREERQKEEAV
jgi:hypothetical protein